MSFLNFDNKTFLITGVANKKSVAYFSAKTISEQGAKLIFSVQSQEHLETVSKLFPEAVVYICNVEDQASIQNMASLIENSGVKLSGLLHSIAFANFSEGPKPFHETKWVDFAQASNISCFSLVTLSNALKNIFTEEASVVTISISSTRATSYGYLGPIKAMLETTCAYLSKSFSEFSGVRFNSVNAGPLKTSASAGIPGYVNNYLFAEELTMRKVALKTQEVANAVAFLLSPVSSGINATGITVDCGMSANYFDQKVVNTFANNRE